MYLHPTMQLDPHIHDVEQPDHYRNAQALQGDRPVVLPEGQGHVDLPSLFVDPSNRQLMRHLEKS